jgi:NAD(P)-dependent dehydrogenase (short-subunit alcohol dehydrogenase family)
VEDSGVFIKYLAIHSLFPCIITHVCAIFQEIAKSLHSAPGKLYPLKCDVSKESDVKETFKWVKSNLGAVDILVNNAGVCDYNNLIGKCNNFLPQFH